MNLYRPPSSYSICLSHAAHIIQLARNALLRQPPILAIPVLNWIRIADHDSTGLLLLILPHASVHPARSFLAETGTTEYARASPEERWTQSPCPGRWLCPSPTEARMTGFLSSSNWSVKYRFLSGKMHPPHLTIHQPRYPLYISGDPFSSMVWGRQTVYSRQINDFWWGGET